MADAFDWLSVLQKVFEKYGSQLHKNQVKKFAAKVARKQGRTEDKKHLQKAFKSFLDTEMGRNNVTAKDDMLSFGPAAAPPQAQSGAPVSAHPPAQARLSLFDLAEAAATLSTASRQASPAPTKSTPTKGKSPHGKDVQQSAPAVPKGQRSARKSKGGSSSPDAEATPAAASASAAAMAASSDGMQTRGRATRRPSIEKQPSGRSALPSKPKTKADKASKAQKQFPQPSTAHTASAATQDASPAVSKPEDIAQTLAPVPSTSDAAPTAVSASHEAEGKPKKQQSKHKEKVGDGSQPAIQAQPLTAAAADGKAIGQQDSPSQQTNSLEPSAEAALAGGAAPSQASAELEAVTGHKKKSKKKRKHSEGLGPGEGTTAAQDAPHAAGAAAEEASAAAPVSEAVQGLAADGTTVKAASKLKKRKKQKHGEDATASRQAAVPSPAPAAEAAVEAAGEAAEAAAVLDGGDPAASQADPGIKHKKKKKRKSKHSGVADQAVPSLPFGSETAAAEAGPSGAAVAAAAATAAEASTAQHEAAAPASEPAAKPKKRKRKHTDTQAQQSAVAAPSSTRLDDAAPTKPAAAETTSQPSEQTAAAAAAAAHDSVPSEEQPAPKAKRKRNSKASDAIPSAEAGVTPVEEAAEQAAAEAAGPAAAQKKARAKKSKAASPKDKASITVSALQSSWRENAKRQDVKKGKFTKQEKDTLKAAAIAYAQEHNLPTTDFAWLFSTRSLNSEYKGQAGGAWRSISESLPHRTNKAVYACGTRMLHERNYQGKWSKEEDEQLRQLVGEKGSKWAEISHSLGRLAEGCRDRWRELKLGDAKLNGRWNKDETERLRTLVNAYMTQKQANDEERSTGGGGLSLTLDDLEAGSPQAEHTQSDGRIILDDIDWDLVSEQHGTRSAAQCLTKWYTQLAPSMVTTGEWGSGDDRRLLRALLKTGAAEDFQVDWGQLVPTRTAHQARRRWRLMLKCVRDANDREFSENLEMLVSTFTPDLLLPSGTSPPKPAKARTPKKSKGKEVVSSPDAAEYPGMSGGMY